MRTKHFRVAGLLLAAALYACSETPSALVDHREVPAFAVTNTIADLVITEIMSDPAAVTDANGEYFELHNTGTATLNLNGLRYNGNSAADQFTVTTDLMVGPRGFVVFGINGNVATNGGVTVNYVYPSAVSLNNSGTDIITITGPDGVVIDRVDVATPRLPAGTAAEVIDAFADNATFPGTNWRGATEFIVGAAGDRGTPGRGNYVPPQPVASITVAPVDATIFTGNTQAFTATLRDADGNPTGGPVTWTSSNESVATISVATGVATAHGQGATTITATSGTITGTTTLNVLANDAPVPTLVITEVMPNPAVVADDQGEWFEVQNTGTEPVDLFGVRILSNNAVENHAISAHLVVPPGAYAVLGISANSATNGNVPVQYAYGTVINLSNSGTTDKLVLQTPDGRLIDEVLYGEAGQPTYNVRNGASRALIDPANDNRILGSTTAWRDSDEQIPGGDLGSPGAPTTVPPDPSVITRISIATSDPGPRIPVGFMKPTFPSARNGSGEAVANQPTFSWVSINPDIATVDARGYVTGVSAGTARIEVTGGGITGFINFTILPATAPTSAEYGNPTSFGVPADATPADDVLLTRAQFTSAFNPARGGPNWVSWTLNPTVFGDADRCNCFSTDGELVALGVPPVHDTDYVGGGYDRGHMVQSESRTSTYQENAATFLFSNILPQAGNNNQGPWLRLENYLNAIAQTGTREVYVVAGAEWGATSETLRNEGKIHVPERTWKVAVIVDRGEDVGDVLTIDDVEIIAASFPNTNTAAANIRNEPWETYRTTVDAIEAATGYDLLAALPDAVERIVEANDHPPTAAITVVTAQPLEGSPVQLDASASSDPDAGDVLSFSWTFHDGTTATGATATKTYADNGSYAVTLTVTDSYGATSTATTSIVVGNADPQITALLSLPPVQSVNDLVAVTGRYSDAGTRDTHQAVVSWGDGTSTPSAEGFGLYAGAHRYARAGFYTISVTITDDDGGAATRVDTRQIVVYDKDAGRVTGGGSFMSPSGSITGNPSATGKTQVSLSLRYSGNDREPEGSFSVVLKSAAFEFSDRRFDWLVVTDGLIHARGTGRLKGSTEDLVFNVIARDGGSQDYMRIRITRADGTVVYDNSPGADFPGAPTVLLDSSNLQQR